MFHVILELMPFIIKHQKFLPFSSVYQIFQDFLPTPSFELSLPFIRLSKIPLPRLFAI